MVAPPIDESRPAIDDVIPWSGEALVKRRPIVVHGQAVSAGNRTSKKPPRLPPLVGRSEAREYGRVVVESIYANRDEIIAKAAKSDLEA